MSKDVVRVKVASDRINCLATIERSMITACNAARKAGEYKLLETLLKIKETVGTEYIASVRKEQ